VEERERQVLIVSDRTLVMGNEEIYTDHDGGAMSLVLAQVKQLRTRIKTSGETKEMLENLQFAMRRIIPSLNDR
jgi:hypothetical protein